MQGWTKLHRKLLLNPIFNKPELLQLFIYCLLRANHDESKIIFNGKEETLEKGSFITGRKVIARDTGQTESAVYKRLDTLRKMGMTTQKSNNRFTVVKVCNYCFYQGQDNEKEQPSNNQVTTREQPSNTDKNVKNVKNVKKKDKDIKTFAQIAFEKFWFTYPKKRSKGDAEKAWAKINMTDTLLEAILDSIENGKQSQDWTKEGGKYIPYPATWLNRKGWEDEYTQAVDVPDAWHIIKEFGREEE